MKTIWVLSGGGSRGCFQAGAISVLAETAPPDAVLGCSAGALNAAGFAYQGAQWLLGMWRQIDSFFDAYRPSWAPWDGGLLDASPERELIRKAIPDGARPQVECIVNFSDLLMDMEITARASVESSSYFRMAVEASTTIPGIAAPVNGRYVDGGVNQMAPVTQALLLGAERIVIIPCFPMEAMPIEEFSQPKTLGVAIRALESALRKSLLKDIRLCMLESPSARIQIVAPPASWDSTAFNFSREAIAEGINLGIRAAKNG